MNIKTRIGLINVKDEKALKEYAQKGYWVSRNGLVWSIDEMSTKHILRVIKLIANNYIKQVKDGSVMMGGMAGIDMGDYDYDVRPAEETDAVNWFKSHPFIRKLRTEKTDPIVREWLRKIPDAILEGEPIFWSVD